MVSLVEDALLDLQQGHVAITSELKCGFWTKTVNAALSSKLGDSERDAAPRTPARCRFLGWRPALRTSRTAH